MRIKLMKVSSDTEISESDNEQEDVSDKQDDMDPTDEFLKRSGRSCVPSHLEDQSSPRSSIDNSRELFFENSSHSSVGTSGQVGASSGIARNILHTNTYVTQVYDTTHGNNTNMCMDKSSISKMPELSSFPETTEPLSNGESHQEQVILLIMHSSDNAENEYGSFDDCFSTRYTPRTIDVQYHDRNTFTKLTEQENQVKQVNSNVCQQILSSSTAEQLRLEGPMTSLPDTSEALEDTRANLHIDQSSIRKNSGPTVNLGNSFQESLELDTHHAMPSSAGSTDGTEVSFVDMDKTSISSLEGPSGYKNNLANNVERPFKCDICERRFSRKDILKRHKRTHTGEKPFICHACEKVFSRICDRERHQLTHTGERPYVCDICLKTFSRKDNLKCHKRIHTDKRE